VGKWIPLGCTVGYKWVTVMVYYQVKEFIKYTYGVNVKYLQLLVFELLQNKEKPHEKSSEYSKLKMFNFKPS